MSVAACAAAFGSLEEMVEGAVGDFSEGFSTNGDAGFPLGRFCVCGEGEGREGGAAEIGPLAATAAASKCQ